MNEPIAVFNQLLIALTCLVSWLGFRSEALEHKYIFHPQAILAWKEYYRLVSSAFLHAGWSHLLWNMLSLYLFGTVVEFVLGPAQFLLIYFSSVIGGNLLSLYVHRHHEYRAYGASGGVCGIIFAHLLLFPGAGISQFLLPIQIPGWLYAILFIGVSFVGMKSNNRGNIGHDAHLGGAIIGFLVTAALHPAIARANWKVFLLVLMLSVLLLIYLWINPLFLPLESFVRKLFHKKSASAKVPVHRRESLEMDAILEKINKSGLDSLSSAERDFLASVSEKYQRRGESRKPESGLAI